jgi:hypothetical protein
MQQWWVRTLLAVVSIIVAYGFASLAIDSGNWFEYAAAVIFLWMGVKHASHAVRFGFAR